MSTNGDSKVRYKSKMAIYGNIKKQFITIIPKTLIILYAKSLMETFYVLMTSLLSLHRHY